MTFPELMYVETFEKPHCSNNVFNSFILIFTEVPTLIPLPEQCYIIHNNPRSALKFNLILESKLDSIKKYFLFFVYIQLQWVRISNHNYKCFSFFFFLNTAVRCQSNIRLYRKNGFTQRAKTAQKLRCRIGALSNFCDKVFAGLQTMLCEIILKIFLSRFFEVFLLLSIIHFFINFFKESFCLSMKIYNFFFRQF